MDGEKYISLYTAVVFAVMTQLGHPRPQSQWRRTPLRLRRNR